MQNKGGTRRERESGGTKEKWVESGTKGTIGLYTPVSNCIGFTGRSVGTEGSCSGGSSEERSGAAPCQFLQTHHGTQLSEAGGASVITDLRKGKKNAAQHLREE